MYRAKEELHRVLILGAGRGGSALLEMFIEEDLVNVAGVMDRDPEAPGMALAKKHGIATYTDLEAALKACAPCIAFNLTNNEMVENVAADMLGAGGVIGGLEARLIWRMVTQLQAAKEDLSYQASHDPLTDAYNRRFLLKKMGSGLKEAARYRFPYSVAIIDLDHFKAINDTYGHEAGDIVLKEATRHLQACMRSVDTLGRWGGEEFLVLLPHTLAAEAVKAADHWLTSLRETPVHFAGKDIPVSFSAGIACFEGEDKSAASDEEADALLVAADRRLYHAKQAGRGRIIGPEEKP